ncbi:MAG: glycosyltransferase family 2 protein [Planctomycetota bacterium]|nr:glycosyltransferase family 2 protein [Planctomycetota bacterium]
MLSAFAILLAIGLLYWIVQSVLLVRTLFVLPVLRPHPSDGPVSPLVSVIVPARDEQGTLEAAVRSRLRDPDAGLEFVLVDDRSEDATGMIMDHLGGTDPRIHVEHVEELPEGWLGKVNAMRVGAEHADGSWLLLSDADVHVAPGTVRAAVELAEQHGADHLAGIPSIRSRSVGMNLCLAPLQRALILLTRLWSVEDPDSSAAMGVGAFNLVRREVFEEAGGFESLRLEVLDDVGVGVMIKQHGGRTMTAFAADCLRIAWYDRFGDFIRGIERGAAKLPPRCPRWLLALVVLLLAVLDLTPFVALAIAWFIPGFAWIGILLSVWVTGLSVAVAVRFGTNPLFAVLVPLNTVLAGLVGMRIMLRSARDGRIAWRGNEYEVDALQAGQRISFERNETGESP